MSSAQSFITERFQIDFFIVVVCKDTSWTVLFPLKCRSVRISAEHAVIFNRIIDKDFINLEK